MPTIIELRPGEGGEDAVLLTKDLANAYIKYLTRVD